MPGLDWIPGVSQLKSTVQLICGDIEGAAQTQANFIQECPGVSQVTSTVQLVAGDVDGALETQKRCLGTINNVANGVPIVGHVKGAIHHAVGDHEGGNQALNAASRSAVVIGTGVAAGFASGGLAAIPAGIAAGTTYDATGTLITGEPQGVIAAVDAAAKNPSAGSIFDATAVFVGDGLTGYSGGQIGKSISKAVQVNRLDAVRAAKTEQLTNGFDGSMSTGEALQLGKDINALTKQIEALKPSGAQYIDPKTNTVVVNHPRGGGPIVPPAPGPSTQWTEEEEGESEEEDINENAKSDLDGFLSDLYHEEKLPSQAAAEKELKYYNKDQTPQKTSLTADAPVRGTKDQHFKGRKLFSGPNQDDRKSKQSKLNQLYGSAFWHIRMPKEFNYTTAAQVNSLTQGLLHSYLDHRGQWEAVVPALVGLGNRLDRLGHFGRLQGLIEAACGDVPLTRQRSEDLRRHLIGLANVDFDEYEAITFEIQRHLHAYIQSQVTSANYLGEGINGQFYQQVYFRVGSQVMVVAVSKELYPSEDFAFGDRRNVRTITTVFFVPFSVFKKRFVAKSFK